MYLYSHRLVMRMSPLCTVAGIYVAPPCPDVLVLLASEAQAARETRKD